MMHYSPQGWFSHDEPPTDELKSETDDGPLARAAPVQSINMSLSCVVLCHPSHRGKWSQYPSDVGDSGTIGLRMAVKLLAI
jgi:hypothetical protein